jgi:DNA-binding transcriptional LysR family regulator
MDIEKISYFFAAAELGNFTKAAGKCGIAQTTMSKYVNTLEQELGCSLFYRTNKGCTLTEQGKVFYEGMKKIRSEYDELRTRVDMTEESVIWIGIEGGHHTQPEFITFERDNPNIGLAVTFGSREELLEQLDTGRCDALMLLGLIPEEDITEGRFESIHLPGKKEYLVCSQSALKKYGSVAGVISELPMVTKDDNQTYHDFCSKGLMKKYGTTFSRVIYSDSIQKQQIIVSLSRGFAIIPKFEIEDGRNLATFPMDESFMTSMQFVYNENRVSRELRKLIDFVKKIFIEDTQ